MTQSDHVARNRRHWDAIAGEYEATGRRNWAEDPTWGIWSIPESQIDLLPDVADKDVL